jgi:circadian clock protein KaiB
MSSTAANKYILRLYIAGQTPRSMTAVAAVRRICEEELGGNYALEIIDVFERPQLAEDEKIIATPTLVKQLPPPLRRVIGDLSDTEKILVGLDLHSIGSDGRKAKP